MIRKITHFFKKVNYRIKERKAETIFVHIGKCGGSTVRKEFRDRNKNFHSKHVCKIDYSDSKKYIILLRNPISRFISALNWRYKLVCIDGVQKNRFEGERELLEKYPTLNELAEAIYNRDGSLNLDFSKEQYYIHHITEDINFYIGNFLKECNQENINAVLVTETLNRDLKDKFNIEVKYHRKKNNTKSDTFLSDLGYNNLKKYLQKDYNCIQEIYKMGLISQEQYKILSK